MTHRDPFHEGEFYVQERAGEREAALRNGAIVGAAIPSRAIPFLAEQRMLAIGTADEQGTVWASVLFGAEGFVSSSDGRSVVIDRTRIHASGDESTWSGVRVGADVGLLAIELGTRRRLRMNGVVNGSDHARIEVSIREAYPNCPKYIQRRQVREAAGGRSVEASPPAHGVRLDAARTKVVEQADTMFVASRHPARGVDVSHRGGAPGFVRMVDASRLRIADYRGNGMFNTFGNFMVDNRAGLVFLDFDGGGLLQMTGTVGVHFDQQEDPRQPAGGTGRYWDFDIAFWRESRIMAPLAWELVDFSPYNPGAHV